MSYIETTVLKNSTIMLLYSEMDTIKLDPEYQRRGDVWTKEKKQLLIDSILNDYDIPKIYFHDLEGTDTEKSKYEYAVIDGRQRLETICQFMEGKFEIANDFTYQKDPTIQLQSLFYNDIGEQYPKIRIRFDSFVLPIILVKTSAKDIDLIEDMFSRLNEAVPLNAAEKRNAIGGDFVEAIRRVSDHRFFKENVKFSNSRYQHREVAARILLVENCFDANKKLIDTKKVYLDALAKEYKSGHNEHVKKIFLDAEEILDNMATLFGKSDDLLSAQGNMVIYYLLFKEAAINNSIPLLSRQKFITFNDKLKENRQAAVDSYETASFELLEYDRLTQQGTNDSSNIKERYKLLSIEMGLQGNLWPN